MVPRHCHPSVSDWMQLHSWEGSSMQTWASKDLYLCVQFPVWCVFVGKGEHSQFATFIMNLRIPWIWASGKKELLLRESLQYYHLSCNIADPFYLTETLLCETLNEDTTENTRDYRVIVLRFLLNHNGLHWFMCWKCNVKVLDQSLKPKWCNVDDFWPG